MTRLLSEPRPACKTVFLGPTDHRGARVKATHLNTKRSVTLAWDHTRDADENHEKAAVTVLAHEHQTINLSTQRLYRCSVDGGGWVWMLV